MRFAWIIFVFIAVCDAVKTSRVKNENLETLNQHVSMPSHSTPKESTPKNRLMPKIQIKDKSTEENNDSSFEQTTRRPLMKSRKFTSKPHAIHYIYSQTHGEQSNFSKRRNSNEKKRFRPYNRNKTTPNSSEDSISIEDRFKNFTDIDDVGEPKRKVSKNRQSNRRRGHLLATAASEQFKSVTLYTLLKANRSKSKSAIQESLQKIKTIRPKNKEIAITMKSFPTKVEDNIKIYGMNNTEENKTMPITTSEESVYSAITTEKLDLLTTIVDNVVNSPTTEDKSSISTTATRSLYESFNTTESSINSMTTYDKLHDAPITTGRSGKTETTSEKVISVAKLENTDDLLATTEKIDISPLTTDKTVLPADKIENSSKSDMENIPVPLIIVTGQPIFPFNKNTTIESIANSDIVSSEVKSKSNFINKDEINIVTVTPMSHEEDISTTKSFKNHLEPRLKRHINIIEEEKSATPLTGLRFSEHETYIDTDIAYRNIHT